MASPIIISQAGPLPIKTTVDWPSTNNVIIAVTGSASAQKANAMVAVRMTIKDTWDTIQLYANQAGTHLTLPAGFFPRSGDFGPITITLSAENANTLTDQNDHFTVALLY